MDETEELKARVEELETALRKMRKASINLLTIVMEYGRGFQDIFVTAMGEREKEIATGDLKARFFGGKKD
jgi:hypothetical protein